MRRGSHTWKLVTAQVPQGVAAYAEARSPRLAIGQFCRCSISWLRFPDTGTVIDIFGREKIVLANAVPGERREGEQSRATRASDSLTIFTMKRMKCVSRPLMMMFLVLGSLAVLTDCFVRPGMCVPTTSCGLTTGRTSSSFSD